MAELEIIGDRAAADLAGLNPTVTASICDARLRYSLLLNDQGGVLDDLMIGHFGKVFYLVVNAGWADHDIGHLQKHLAALSKLTVRTDQALLALQGPQSASVLNRLGLDLTDFRFMQIRHFDFHATPLLMTRPGYTGPLVTAIWSAPARRWR